MPPKNSGATQWRNRQGADSSPEISDREIFARMFADVSGKKRLGKKGKVGNICFGFTKMEISYREKEFHAGKYDFAPQKNMPVTPLVPPRFLLFPHFSSPTIPKL